jgi:aminoglycoside phosphotransferase
VWKFVLHAGFYMGWLGSVLAAAYKVPPDEPLAVLQVPDEWQTKKHGELFEITSPDGTMHFLVVRPEPNKISESMGEVMRYIRNAGGIIVKADSLKREAEELNDMHVRRVSWMGKDQNGEVRITFNAISIAQNELLLTASWGSPAAEKKYRAQLHNIFKSIRKALR